MFKAHGHLQRHGTLLVVLASASFLCARPASAQLAIQNADNTSNIKFGALLQTWADWSQSADTAGYSQNLYLRRFRLIVGGQIMPGLTFFAETDDPNLGKTVEGTKTISSGFIVQDAYLEYKKTDAIFLDAGIFLVPFCRNCINGASGLMSLDYGAFSFVASGPTHSVTGRDTGFQLRGYVLGDHLEYRAAVEQGVRDTASNNSFRFTGRVQYDFLDTEKVPYFYSGTYFGTKKVLAIGGGIDTQKDYKAYAGDGFFDYPVGDGSVTAETNFIHYDGGTTLDIPKQDDFMVQAGYFFAPVKLFPYVRYENRHFVDSADQTNDQKRYLGGIGYYLKGQNANVKLGYTRVIPKSGSATNELTLQLQAFYF